MSRGNAVPPLARISTLAAACSQRDDSATTFRRCTGSDSSRVTPGLDRRRSPKGSLIELAGEAALIQTDTVRSFSHREARDVLGSRPPFVIQGVLRNSINLVFGVSENGKSTVATSMVAAMINGDTHWLGREIQPGNWSAGIVTGDAGETEDYERRFSALLKPATAERVYYHEPLFLPPAAQTWADIMTITVGQRHNLLVVDNLTTFVPGTLNDDNAVSPLMNALHAFSQRGITVIALAHVSEKRNQFGAKSHNPLGSSVITARSRWRTEVERLGDDDLKLTFSGNGGAPSEIRARVTDWPAVRLELTSDANHDELRERRERRQRQRGDDRRTKREQYADYVLTNCQAMNGKQAAEALATRFTGPKSPKATTHESQLSRGAYGVRLIAGSWQRCSAIAS